MTFSILPIRGHNVFFCFPTDRTSLATGINNECSLIPLFEDGQWYRMPRTFRHKNSPITEIK